MPLESLRQPFDPEQAGHKLREVQLEEESQPERFEWKAHLKALKDNPMFYDSEKALWVTGDLGDATPHYYVFDQLLALYIESGEDVEEAKERYDELQGREEFRLSRYSGQNILGVVMLDYSLQLMLQERFHDEQISKEACACFALSKNTFSKTDRELQNHYGAPVMFEDYAVHQLLPLYAEIASHRIPEEQAKAHYEDYKKRFFINEKWQTTGAQPSTHAAVAEFLAILIESEWDSAKARQHFAELKKSELYDDATNLWRGSKGESEEKGAIQLFSVLVEQKLGIENPHLAPPQKLPEERNF